MQATNGKILNPGKVISVQGPVVDVKFLNLNDVPDIYDVIFVMAVDGRELTLEVAEHLPNNIARCISIQATINIQRYSTAKPSGKPI